LVLNALPGAQSLRDPGHPRLFHIRAGDKQQIEKIVNHAHTLGMTRLGVLYQDLPIGTSGFGVAQQAAAQAGGIDLKSAKSTADHAAISAAAGELAKQERQGLIVIGSPKFMAEGATALRKAGISQPIFVLSYVTANVVVKLAGLEGARGVIVTQTYPNPQGHNLPVQRDFQAAMKAAFPEVQEYTSLHMEGYLSARTVVEAFKRSKERDISAAGLARALPAAGDIDMGGYRVNFSDGNAGSRFVDISVIGSDGKLKY
jgi:branched-chain amino acid transport system substrate-binding protein